MLWTLWLIFLFAGSEPEYVRVEAEDGASCAAQGQALQDALDAESFSGMRWVCVGPDGETLIDKPTGE